MIVFTESRAVTCVHACTTTYTEKIRITSAAVRRRLNLHGEKSGTDRIEIGPKATINETNGDVLESTKPREDECELKTLVIPPRLLLYKAKLLLK